MRVIAGKARASKLISPQGLETRPTSDRIKETLFNIIGHNLYELSFLDIFSGSGAIGIEALSRGAKEATFIEASKAACQVIKQNVEKTRFQDQSVILNLPADKALHKLKAQNKQYDLIFMDPPYHEDFINDTLQLIIDMQLLKADGYIIVERPTSYPLKISEELTLWREKKYSVTTMSILKGV